MPFPKALLICATAMLTGCVSMSYPLPKCDGAAKRPLNRSMWQWQEERAGISGSSTEPSPIMTAAPLSYSNLAPAPQSGHQAFAAFDEAGSRRACGAG